MKHILRRKKMTVGSMLKQYFNLPLIAQVTNTGNVNLTKVLLQHGDVVYDECPFVVLNDEALGPGESFSCNGTHALMWFDIEAGELNKEAR